MIAFTCATCDKQCEVPDHYAGKTVKCPSCDSLWTVPHARAGQPIIRSSVAPREQEREEAEDEPWFYRCVEAMAGFALGICGLVLVGIIIYAFYSGNPMLLIPAGVATLAGIFWGAITLLFVDIGRSLREIKHRHD